MPTHVESRYSVPRVLLIDDGATRTLAKPFSREDLLKAIADALAHEAPE
jgi:hypothetical protein